MFALICHVDHVSDDQLGHDLKNHLTGQFFGRAAFGNEAQRVLEELDETLARLDRQGFKFDLFVRADLLLDCLLVWFFLSKVQWQPMSESFIFQRFAHFLFGKGTKTE